MDNAAIEREQPVKCQGKTEVYSRVCGFFRPVQQWNLGKREEYLHRKEFVIDDNAGLML